MRIGMILDAPFPPDIRVEKEATSLEKAGHEIYIMSRFSPSFLTEEKYEHFNVSRFDTNQYRILKRLTREYKKITFYDPVWAKGIDDFVNDNRIDVLHVHDLPQVKTAVRVAEKHRIPVVADFHEDYPAHLQAVQPEKMSKLRQFYRSYNRWEDYEGDISRKVDRIITVVQKQKEHLIYDHKVNPDKITVVHNTVDIDQFKGSPTGHISNNDEFIISYIGSISPYRGLDMAIRAMPEIVSKIPTARLVIVGKGGGGSVKELQNRAAQLNVSNSVKFLGWKKYSELPFYFRQADVGILPPYAYKHTEIAAPNKLFEYMYFKVPLLVSDRPTLKAFMEETNAGLAFRTGEAEDFAKKLLEIYGNPNGYGENGHKAVMEKYNWKIDGERLVSLYNSIGGQESNA
jgi:glycosyltransferase involved in cell wall biosynthesis